MAVISLVIGEGEGSLWHLRRGLLDLWCFFHRLEFCFGYENGLGLDCSAFVLGFDGP